MATELAPMDAKIEVDAKRPDTESDLPLDDAIPSPDDPAGTPRSAIASGLVWLDRHVGPAWSSRSLRTCLGIALVYSWIVYFLSWGLDGSGRIGRVSLLADPPQPARLLSSLSAIFLPLIAMLIGRSLGRLERRAKLSCVRWFRRNPKQYRQRLRVDDFERRYRWLLGLVFGSALVAVLIWFRRGDVAAFTILFSWLALGPVSGIAMARRFSNPTTQGLAALIAGFGSITGAVLLILAFAGAGVSAFAFAILGVTNVAFAGAVGVLLEIVMGGVFTLGLALAGAGIATVALALAGAGTGIATLTGVATMSRAGLAAFILLMGGASLATLAFSQATVLAAAIGGISALSVAAAVSHNRRGRHGAYAGAIGAIALLTVAAVLLGWGHKPLVIFAVCFFFLLPLTNGPVDWLAWATTRTVIKRLLPVRSIALSVSVGSLACLLVSLVLVSCLAFFLGFGFEGYNQLTLQRSGQAAFNLSPMIDQAITDPWGEGLWLTLMLLTPLVPIAFQASRLITDGLLILQPDDYPLRRPLFNMISFLLTLATVVIIAWSITISSSLDLADSLGTLGDLGMRTAKDLWQPLS
ncbi:MAG: hypothetical protein ACR2QH_12225 [Geminicoccaceae bacterium]